MSKLILRGLEKRFGGVAAVAGLDLELVQDEFVSLLGPSRSRRTATSSRIIARFVIRVIGHGFMVRSS